MGIEWLNQSSYFVCKMECCLIGTKFQSKLKTENWAITDVFYHMAGIDIPNERFILYIIHIRLVGISDC